MQIFAFFPIVLFLSKTIRERRPLTKKENEVAWEGGEERQEQEAEVNLRHGERKEQAIGPDTVNVESL